MQHRNPIRWIIAAVTALAVIAALAGSIRYFSNAAAATGGGGTGTERAGATVTVTGDPLPTFDPAANPDTASGARVALITGTAPDGTTSTITTDGRPMLLVVVAANCPICEDTLRELTVQHAAAGGDSADGQVVVVASGADTEMTAEMVARSGWPGQVLVDTTQRTARTALGVPDDTVPAMIVTDPGGRVVLRVSAIVAVGPVVAVYTAQLAVAAAPTSTVPVPPPPATEPPTPPTTATTASTVDDTTSTVTPGGDLDVPADTTPIPG